MNLKERLTSTENLLRSIRSGETVASRAPGGAEPSATQGRGSIWTRRVSLGGIFSGRNRPEAAAPPVAASSSDTPKAEAPKAEASAAPSAQAPKPFWTRQINFRRSSKALTIGISVSGPSLCIAAVRSSSSAITAARCFPMGPGQAPGDKGFAAFLRACLSTLGYADASADFWAVLRSSDLDLNVLPVPKLSGGKLDAAVYWTLQKEKKFAEAEYVLDYLVLGHTADAKDAKLDVLTCLARRADVDRLRESFREAGYPLAGITSIPSAFLALYRQHGAPAGHALAANIHVEPDFSAIGLYAKDRLRFSRFIRSGAGSMADTLVEHFQELAKPKTAPLDDLELTLPGTPQPDPEPEEQAAQPIDADQAQALLQHVLLGAPKPAFATPAHLLSPAQMIDIIAPAIERLARQVERTLDYYAGSQKERCDALHLSGGIFGSPAITQALAGQLGYPPVVFDPADILTGSGLPLSPADRMLLAPALAAALSQPGKGINLLANYKVRTAQEAKRTITSSLVLGLAALMLLIGAAGFVLERGLAAKRQELARIKTRLAALGPALDESSLEATVNLFKTHQNSLREASARLLAPAALTEIGLRAPENVRILSFAVDYPGAQTAEAPATPGQPQQPQQPQAGQKAAPKTNGVVVIEGIVTGDRAEFDASLSRFILALQASPMFAMPVVNESGLKELGSGAQVLYFNMHLGVK